MKLSKAQLEECRRLQGVVRIASDNLNAFLSYVFKEHVVDVMAFQIDMQTGEFVPIQRADK